MGEKQIMVSDRSFGDWFGELDKSTSLGSTNDLCVLRVSQCQLIDFGQLSNEFDNVDIEDDDVDKNTSYNNEAKCIVDAPAASSSESIDAAKQKSRGERKSGGVVEQIISEIKEETETKQKNRGGVYPNNSITKEEKNCVGNDSTEEGKKKTLEIEVRAREILKERLESKMIGERFQQERLSSISDGIRDILDDVCVESQELDLDMSDTLINLLSVVNNDDEIDHVEIQNRSPRNSTHQKSRTTHSPDGSSSKPKRACIPFAEAKARSRSSIAGYTQAAATVAAASGFGGLSISLHDNRPRNTKRTDQLSLSSHRRGDRNKRGQSDQLSSSSYHGSSRRLQTSISPSPGTRRRSYSSSRPKKLLGEENGEDVIQAKIDEIVALCSKDLDFDPAIAGSSPRKQRRKGRKEDILLASAADREPKVPICLEVEGGDSLSKSERSSSSHRRRSSSKNSSGSRARRRQRGKQRSSAGERDNSEPERGEEFLQYGDRSRSRTGRRNREERRNGEIILGRPHGETEEYGQREQVTRSLHGRQKEETLLGTTSERTTRSLEGRSLSQSRQSSNSRHRSRSGNRRRRRRKSDTAVDSTLID